MFNRTDKFEWFSGSKAECGESWSLTYHGVAGFTLAARQTTLVLDPFVTRPGLFATALTRLQPNSRLISEVFPVADAVLVGHSHHDHILDAPELCHQTGAQFFGSPDSANVARAAGLSEAQITETIGGEMFSVKAAQIQAIPSRHGRVYFNHTPLPGRITQPPQWPPRVWELKHGAVLNWMVHIGGLTMVHIDTAEVIDEHLDGKSADVVCLCAIGRKYRPGLVESVVSRLKPKWIVPCHWDWFFSPYDGPHRFLPGVNLSGFVSEIESFGVRAAPISIGSKLTLPDTPDSV